MPRVTRQLDRSQGRAFIHEGVIFYSPNCSRNVKVPKFQSRTYPFHRQTANLAQFQDPDWWSDAYGYLSFIPCVPSFEGSAFGDLHEFVHHIQRVEAPWGLGYGLSQEKLEKWLLLEDVLIVTIHLLKSKFLISILPYFLPLAPSQIGFIGPFFDPRGAQYRIGRSRDWFAVWVGLLSFFIACIERNNNNDQVAPDWFSYLASRQEVDQSWLSGLHDTIMSGIWNRKHCVSTFINFFQRSLHREDHLVKWLCDWNVPVWYRCSSAEMNYFENPLYSYLRPLPEQLQAATTMICKSPSRSATPPAISSETASNSTRHPSVPPSPPSTSIDSLPSVEDHIAAQRDFRRARDAYVATKPWDSFFAARNVTNRRILDKETPQKRESRLNRERNPPEVSAEVFEWVWSDEDPLCLVRTRVPKRERQERICYYTGPRRRYDPVQNQWDLCEFFGSAEERARVPNWGDEDDSDNELDNDGGDYRNPQGVSSLESAAASVEDSVPDTQEANSSGGVVFTVYKPPPEGTSFPEITGSSPRHQPPDIDYDKKFQGMIPEATDSNSNPAFEQKSAEDFVAGRVSAHLGVLPSIPVVPALPTESHSSSAAVDLVDYLASHYGYLSPLPVPVDTPVPDLTLWNGYVKTVGLRSGTANTPPLDFGYSMYHFLQGLQMAAGPPSSLYDLMLDSRSPLSSNTIATVIRKVSTNLFFVKRDCLLPEPAVAWTIALASPVDAVKAARLILRDRYSAISLAHSLLEMGTTFRTLQPISCSPSVFLLASKTILPFCVSDHKFQTLDFHVYVQQRARILSSPRGRAALLAGGLLRRLAGEHIGLDSASFGPSSAVTEHHIGFTFEVPGEAIYWDDMLTDEEILVICGYHHCYTGNGTQFAKLSWWPLPDQWNSARNGYNFEHWTELDKEWYQARLSLILEGRAKPETPNYWRNNLKGPSSWRKVTSRLALDSDRVVSELLMT